MIHSNLFKITKNISIFTRAVATVLALLGLSMVAGGLGAAYGTVTK
jgi:hypothetical protein